MKKTLVFLLLHAVLLMPPIIGKAAEMDFKTMDTGDAHIAYKIIDEGDSENTALLIMGYGCTMDMWPTKMIEALKEYGRLILFDNRGMGYSSGGSRAFSIELFAEDTNALLDSLGVERISLIGWSMGTAIALQTALDRPDRVQNLALISAFCGGEKSVWPTDQVWERVLDLSGTVDERVQRMMNNLFPQAFLDANPRLTNVFPEIVEPVNDEMIARQGLTIKQWKGCHSDLGKLQVPVLLIAGDKDIVIPMENSKIIASQLGRSTVRIIEGGGHGVLYQNPEQISTAIISLMK